ncbi:MAG: hypothetical protein M1823_002651 [Watsoniomyces obsoletus]|nr:MAG: hypothetical protein M1823_002651 [Watsoniomyces obsoletus]
MAPAAPTLPTRFPCWCRAIYSWGGESKRDLGFVEGDLIECLNAGDGSWWTGRLRRDRRMIGIFPSNFVQVLDASFQPGSRSPSPMPSVAGSHSRTNSTLGAPNAKPEKTPSKSYRKPFQAYAKAATPKSTAVIKQQETQDRDKTPKPSVSRQPSTASYMSRDDRNGSFQIRSRSPAPSASHHQRQRSPAPPAHVYHSRPPSVNGSFNMRSRSPAPPADSYQRSRPPAPPADPYQRSRSPAPSSYAYHSRPPSANPEDAAEDSPPPPPPPHRVHYDPHAAVPPPAPAHRQTPRGHAISRQASPAPPSPMITGQTPSPLRDAMEDVMSSLDEMGLQREGTPSRFSQSPQLPWSPEAFELQYRPTRTRPKARPRSSLGIGGRDQLDSDEDETYGTGNSSVPQYHEPARAPSASHEDMNGEPSWPRAAGISTHDFADELFFTTGVSNDVAPQSHGAPAAPPHDARPPSSLSRRGTGKGSIDSGKSLKKRKSAYEIGRDVLNRTFTTRSNTTTTSSGVHSIVTDHSTSTQITSASIMSGPSAGGFSATSAASLARRKGATFSSASRPMSVMEMRGGDARGITSRGSIRNRGPDGASTGVVYHSGEASGSGTSSAAQWTGGDTKDSSDVFSTFSTPKAKKSGFFKKIIESAKTGAAGARSTIGSGQPTPPHSPTKGVLPNGVTSIAGGPIARAHTSSNNGSVDWVQVRRDVNRSNSLSRNEKTERQERCQMMDHPVIRPIDALHELAEGDEGADGRPVYEPTNYQGVNFAMVDKSTRFIGNLPQTTNSTSLAQGYVCRPYRSDAQRLRAIFTWVSEKVAWEEDFEGDIDTRRVIQTKRGCAEEVAVLVMEMGAAVGIHAEVVRGYLKGPGEVFEGNTIPHPNHWWNAVVVDGEWRIMDCSLASPTNPRRPQYSSAGSQVAENWWYLVRPTEACYTHVPVLPEQQHICPPVLPDVLFALPCACPPYFRNDLRLVDFDTSASRIEDLELVHLHFLVPADIECVAEVEANAFERDLDGDYFESGEVVRKRALAQADWVAGEKRYTVKALLPGDEGHGVLKVYAGKRGLMHSNKDNPYPLAFAMPIIHTGTNPPYDFLVRHPTPHAQRHDLYVVQPQCARLAINNTFVFAVRQHPSSAANAISDEDSAPSVSSSARPTSALSMATTNSSAFGTTLSQSGAQRKPAKLAIQAPSGKIMRLMRKSEHTMSTSGPGGGEGGDGGLWETIIKCGERGVWRCLVLADRSARWCVFAEWTCV